MVILLIEFITKTLYFPSRNFLVSETHCLKTLLGTMIRVAFVGINPSSSGGLMSLSYCASIRPRMTAVLPYPTSSASTPPRTTFGIVALTSARQGIRERMDSSTSSSMNGSMISASCEIIQPNDRSCSSRSRNLKLGGCGEGLSLSLLFKVNLSGVA